MLLQCTSPTRCYEIKISQTLNVEWPGTSSGLVNVGRRSILQVLSLEHEEGEGKEEKNE